MPAIPVPSLGASASANDHGLYLTNIERCATRAIDRSTGNRMGSMLGSGRQREVGISATNGMPFDTLELGHQREALPTSSNYWNLCRNQQAEHVGRQGSTRGWVEHYFRQWKVEHARRLLLKRGSAN